WAYKRWPDRARFRAFWQQREADLRQLAARLRQVARLLGPAEGGQEPPPESSLSPEPPGGHSQVGAGADQGGGPSEQQEAELASLLEQLPRTISATDLAEKLGMPSSTVEPHLRRLRAKYDDCFQETEGRRKNEPRYMYRTAEVLPSLLEKRKRSRPTDG